MTIYKRYCNTCGKYYEGKGKLYCSLKCRPTSKTCYKKGHLPTSGAFKKGHKLLKKSIEKMKNTKKENGVIPWNIGLKMDKEFCKKASERQKGIIPSKETLIKRSKSLRGKLPKNKGYGKRIYCESPFQRNICLRSSYEYVYIKYLNLNNIKWYYEFMTFDLDDTTYTPDFFLPETNQFIEIKGYMHTEAKIKIDKFNEKYPEKKLKILYKKDLKELGCKL